MRLKTDVRLKRTHALSGPAKPAYVRLPFQTDVRLKQIHNTPKTDACHGFHAILAATMSNPEPEIHINRCKTNTYITPGWSNINP